MRADLVGGADWTEEASKYSDDAGTKDNGGDLGTVYKGEMVAEFEDSVFSMKTDEISEPVKTIYGYHVIQVTSITEAKQYSLDEVKSDISSNLVNQEKAQVWQDWIAKTKIELGVVYKPGMELTTTTTAPSVDTTTGLRRHLDHRGWHRYHSSRRREYDFHCGRHGNNRRTRDYYYCRTVG